VSRYQLDPLPRFRSYDIAVGWDPAGTFFAYVFNPHGGSAGVEVLNVGSQPGEITNAYDVIHRVHPYAEIPPSLIDQLSADARRDGHAGTPHG